MTLAVREKCWEVDYMVRVSVDEIKQNLSVYLPRVEGGETVVR